ncbi:LysR family transcriptional regulator [Pseudomonas ovata]|uniref:LysR family transcriptional regulator n=1 Tax=Pseudomonas ovata TaxID=1839709 RepID=UPI000D69BEEA|nr:LysR family transcriptional regulator [Pseudomonas ovata]
MHDNLLRDSFPGLKVFFAVARERSFTRAAAHLGLSQTAVSHAVSGLEKKLGVRLLIRNSRRVIPTEAGERLLVHVAPQFAEIDAELAALSELRDNPTGTIRITASDHPIRTVIAPRLKSFLPLYPGIKVELCADNGLTDIAAKQFDAGVRLSEAVPQDMIAVRISPDVRFAAVATRRYFAEHPVPHQPDDLLQHNCINLRLPTYGGLWPWEFEQHERIVNVRVDGQMVFNSIYDCRDAAVAGLGIAYVPQDLVLPYIDSGHLVHVLQDWSPYWTGYHLFYSSRRQTSGAMALLIAALRHSG